MRRERDVFQGEQPGVDARLVLEDVEAGAVEVAGLEGGDEGGFVEDWAAGGVDEDGVGFHERQAAGVDEVASLRRERGVEAHDIGLGETVVEFNAAGAEGGEFKVQLAGSRDVERAHAQGHGSQGEGLADAPGADDEEGLAGEVLAHPAEREPVAFVLEAAGADEAIGGGDVAGDAEQEAKGDVRGALGHGVGRVGDGDASRLACGQIDVVYTDAEVADRAKAGAGGV